MNVKSMCKLINELRPDVDISVAGIFGKGINDRAWFYSTIYDSKPPNFENLATKDKEVLSVDVVKDEKLNVENVIVYFDMNKKKGEENKMKNKADNREPLKLLTLLSYIVGDEDGKVWVEMRLEKRNEYDSKYMFIEGFAEDLKDYPSTFEGYYVDRILYDDGDDYENEEERHLLIQAVKEENENENNNRN